MATGVQIFKSTDASAPVLSGQTGSLCTVLDACLVNGYGSVNPAGHNGAGAWTIAYTGTSKRAYRPSAGNRFYLRVQDDGPGAGTYKECRVVSYETMSDVDTGTNPMPTVAQFANGLFVRKSNTADSTARAWTILADDRTLYMFLSTGDQASYFGYMWGDFYSNLAGDAYRTALVARNGENVSAQGNTDLGAAGYGSNFPNLGGHYMQRNRNGTVGSIQFFPTAVLTYDNATAVWGNRAEFSLAYPNPEDGGLYLMPLFMIDAATSPTYSVRGRIRGLWDNPHVPSSFNNGDSFTGVGDFSGKTFQVVKNTGSTAGVLIVETSDTWDTSS